MWGLSYWPITRNRIKIIVFEVRLRYILLLHLQARHSIFHMRHLIVLLFSVALLQAPSLACADFDGGMAAFQRGDYETALEEFRALAEQGDADAQAMLGGMYSAGRGVPRNYMEAVKWARLAAEQGHSEAQFSLAISHAFGFGGLSIDVVESYKWAAIAASNGMADAVKFQEYIAEEMTNQEIETARHRAGECIKNNHKGCVGQQPNKAVTQPQGDVRDIQEIPEPNRLEKSKAECEELGFTPKTEAFGNCVLKLIE